MPKYAEHINSVLREIVASRDELLIYGQNVSTGSRIGGLTRGLDTLVKGKSKMVNTTNSENSLVGFGFGVMLGGGAAAFFMKQLDFLLLGIDQLVNTHNIIRNGGHAKGSFTIVPTVVDVANKGPHSSSNNFADFCSIARIQGFTITNKYDAEKVLATHFAAPGFRIIGVSHRLLKEEIIDPGTPVSADKGMKFVQYKDGRDATIVCFNFSFPYGWRLAQELEKIGKRPAFFNVNYMTPIDWTPILASAKKTGKLVVMDDSNSENLSCFSLVAEARKMDLAKDMVIISKPVENWFSPVSSVADMDYEKIARELAHDAKK
jgi:acetoin:2,6-dichlorophenolindophenol oxidoreductase subunit beta